MDQRKLKQLEQHLGQVYQSDQIVTELTTQIQQLGSAYGNLAKGASWLDETDTILITYGDTIQKEGQKHLDTLYEFLDQYVGDTIQTVHLLPMYPYTSDDGFSVVDYEQIDPPLGNWQSIEKLSSKYDLMFDAVINHISKSSSWFTGFLAGDEKYEDYFMVSDPEADYSKVTRPRALPLLTAFDTAKGKKYIWTTFSEDQIDLNYRNPKVFMEVLKVLLSYASRGARFIRLDAIGFMWKEPGTSCMHLEQTHALIKAMRIVLDAYIPGTILITETNVPHEDNITYFGNGYNEAGLVYQFPLPPLTMFTYLSEDATYLTKWAASLKTPSDQTAYFNFLSSHDGIGVRPVEGILSPEEQQLLVDATLRRGGRVSYRDNGDGTKSPYELNINYQDALSDPDDTDEIRRKRFLGAQTILLSLQGMPGIYIHSLLGSKNDYYGVESSGINRRINREKLKFSHLEADLEKGENRSLIFQEMLRRIRIRKAHTAFSPQAEQRILELGKSVFAICRRNPVTQETIYVLINVSTSPQMIQIPDLQGYDLLHEETVSAAVSMEPLQTRWVVTNN